MRLAAVFANAPGKMATSGDPRPTWWLQDVPNARYIFYFSTESFGSDTTSGLLVFHEQMCLPDRPETYQSILALLASPARNVQYTTSRRSNYAGGLCMDKAIRGKEPSQLHLTA